MRDPLEGVFRNQSMAGRSASGPIEGDLHIPNRPILGPVAGPSGMRPHPLLHVIGAAGRNEAPAVLLRKGLKIRSADLERATRQALLGKSQVAFDHRGDRLLAGFRPEVMHCGEPQFHQPLCGRSAILAIEGQLNLAAIQPTHPPAGLLVVPGPRSARHFQSSHE